MLRYGSVADFRYSAASVISSYDYLLSEEIDEDESVRRLREMRWIRRLAVFAITPFSGQVGALT